MTTEDKKTEPLTAGPPAAKPAPRRAGKPKTPYARGVRSLKRSASKSKLSLRAFMRKEAQTSTPRSTAAQQWCKNKGISLS